MKKLFVIVLVFVYPYMAFSQIPPLNFDSQKNISIMSNSEETQKVTIEEKLPKPGEDDFEVKMYIYLSKLMAAKANTLDKQIEYEYSRKLMKLNEELEETSDIDEIKRIKEEMRSIETEMKNKKIERVNYIYGLSKEFDFKSRTNDYVFLFSKHLVKNAYDAQVFYNQTISEKSAKFLSNSVINFGGNGEKVSLFNELYSDYFGPSRVGLGVLISNKSNKTDSIESQKDAVQRLLGGGGNGIISVSYPLFGYHSEYNNFNIKSLFSPKISFDVPKLGTDNDEYGINYDFGVDVMMFYSGLLDLLTLYTNYRISSINGNSIFFENLGKDRSAFTFNQLSIGVALNSTFRLSWNYYFGSDFIKSNFPSTISFAIIPN